MLRTAAALWAALGASTAAAQTGTWSIERPPEETEGPAWALNYDAAYAVRQGSDARSVGKSVAFQLSLEKREHELLWCGLELGHQFGHELKGRSSGRYIVDVDGDKQGDVLDFDSDVKVKVFHLAPYLRLGKVFGKRGGLALRHTVSLGAGLYHWTSNAGTLSMTGTTSNGTKATGLQAPYEAASSAHFGGNFGTALDLHVREGLSVGVELRYHNLFDATEDIGYLLPAARLTFLF